MQSHPSKWPAMFADDTKLFTIVKREDNCKRLQGDLDNLQTRSLATGLPCNEKKKVESATNHEENHPKRLQLQTEHTKHTTNHQ